MQGVVHAPSRTPMRAGVSGRTASHRLSPRPEGQQLQAGAPMVAIRDEASSRLGGWGTAIHKHARRKHPITRAKPMAHPKQAERDVVSYLYLECSTVRRGAMYVCHTAKLGFRYGNSEPFLHCLAYATHSTTNSTAQHSKTQRSTFIYIALCHTQHGTQ